MSPWRAIIPALALAASPAAAQPVTNSQFQGTAHIGSAARNVVIRFSCAVVHSKMASLAVELDVPEAKSLIPVFNFDAFEGPTGIGGHHRLVATAGAARTQMDFTSTGVYGANGAADNTFTFSAAMMPDVKGGASLMKLRAIVGTLASGPSHLSYSVENPARGRPPIEASVDIAGADLTGLTTAMAPCLRTQAR
jgi:hypothetical protein